MTLQFKQFKTLFLNTLWDTKDHTNMNQCFDLAIGWCKYLGIPDTIFSGLLYASDIWNKPTQASKQYFDFIPNTPDGVPQAGDIVVFAGIPGHVSIADEGGNLSTFISLDQNIKYDIQLITHNYDSPKVLGWLRFKAPQQPTTPTTPTDDKDKLILQLKAENTVKDNAITQKDILLKEWEFQFGKLSEELKTCQNKPDSSLELQNKLTKVTAQYKKLLATPSKFQTDMLLKICEKLEIPI